MGRYQGQRVTVKKSGKKKGQSAKIEKKVKYEHGAKHLYTTMRQSLSGNLLDEWLEIMGARTEQDYADFNKVIALKQTKILKKNEETKIH